MRHILVMNAKGGCGKSTLATNIAAWYAGQARANVVLADFDPQASSAGWAASRPAKYAPIAGLRAFHTGLRGVGHQTDIVVMDAPARSHGSELAELVDLADLIVMPVLPSPIDMQASERFLNEMLAVVERQRSHVRIASVANRVRKKTLIYDKLEAFLRDLPVPHATSLRDAQNYIRAYAQGAGIFELPEYLAWPDWEQWLGLLEWLEDSGSGAH